MMQNDVAAIEIKKGYDSATRVFSQTLDRRAVYAFMGRMYDLMSANGAATSKCISELFAARKRGKLIDTLAQNPEMLRTSKHVHADALRSYYDNALYARRTFKNEGYVFCEQNQLHGFFDSGEWEDDKDTGERWSVVNDWKSLESFDKIKYKTEIFTEQLGVYYLCLLDSRRRNGTEMPSKYRLTFFAEGQNRARVYNYDPIEIAGAAERFLERLERYRKFPEIENEYIVFDAQNKLPAYQVPTLLAHGRKRIKKRERVNPLHIEWCGNVRRGKEYKLTLF